jgi:hypothetical protein
MNGFVNVIVPPNENSPVGYPAEQLTLVFALFPGVG